MELLLLCLCPLWFSAGYSDIWYLSSIHFLISGSFLSCFMESAYFSNFSNVSLTNLVGESLGVWQPIPHPLNALFSTGTCRHILKFFRCITAPQLPGVLCDVLTRFLCCSPELVQNQQSKFSVRRLSYHTNAGSNNLRKWKDRAVGWSGKCEFCYFIF